MAQDVLCEADVRALVRVLGEVAGMKAAVAERKTRLMQRLLELVDADVWLWTVTNIRGSDFSAVRMLQGGLSHEQVARFYEVSNETEPQPEAEPLLALAQRGEAFTRRRHELVPDEVWNARAARDPAYAVLGVDQSLYSFTPLEAGVWSCVGIHRRFGRPAFSARDARLVHIVLSEIPWLHRADVPEAAGAELVPRLTPRLRTVFGLMMEGLTRSQIAEHLGLSHYTVRDYMSEIYRHFEVRSQVELMRRLTVGDGGDRDNGEAAGV